MKNWSHHGDKDRTGLHPNWNYPSQSSSWEGWHVTLSLIRLIKMVLGVSMEKWLGNHVLFP